VRKHILWASATLAVIIAACGSSTPTATASPSPSTSPSPTCVNATAPHHAYVVVEHLAGTWLYRCVGFSGDTIDGQSLMDQSGIQYQTQTFSFGKAVCQIDNEPATFTQCFPQNAPTWGLFIATGGAWTVAQTGYAAVNLHDKDELGWHYQAATATPAPPPLAAQ
jgi:hypothetical protein